MYILCLENMCLITCVFETIYDGIDEHICIVLLDQHVWVLILLLENMYMSILLYFCQMQGFKRKQKKQWLSRLFAVCRQSATAFVVCILSAKVTRGTQLCNLGTDWVPFGLYAVCIYKIDDKEHYYALCPADGKD